MLYLNSAYVTIATGIR